MLRKISLSNLVLCWSFQIFLLVLFSVFVTNSWKQCDYVWLWFFANGFFGLSFFILMVIKMIKRSHLYIFLTELLSFLAMLASIPYFIDWMGGCIG